MRLRPYQERMVSEVSGLFKGGKRSVMVQAPTGCGKTALAAHMLGATVAKGKRASFFVHRRELLTQSAKAFELTGIPYYVVGSNWMRRVKETPGRGVLLAAIQTIGRRASSMTPPDLMVFDEAHHIAAKSWTSLYEWGARSYVVGLSATPERLDGKGLDKWFQAMVEGPTTAQLIADGFLCPYRLFVPPGGIDTQGVKRQMGDFARGQLVAVSDRPVITGDAIAHYQLHSAGKRAVAFCVSVEHSKHVAEQFRAAGIQAVHCDGSTDSAVRDGMLEDFREGKIKVLTNVDLFGEGFDVPSIETVIMLRPTQSVGLYLQQVGRALRPFEGKKEAIILDHAGNARSHGRPDGIWCWDLYGREARERKEKALPTRSPKICEKCFAACTPWALACPICGTTFKTAGRSLETVAGSLVEAITAPNPSFKVTVEDFERMFKRRGVANPRALAEKTFRQREAKNAAHA